jgi:hypothetical protein
MPPADMLPMSEIVLERRELHVIWVRNQVHFPTEELDKRVGSDELNSPSLSARTFIRWCL